MTSADSTTSTMAPAKDGSAAPPPIPTSAREAAATATAQNSIRVDIPGVGHVDLPPLEHIAFLGGVASLALLQIIEWPVAAVLAVGHVLAHNRHHALLRAFGEALDEA